MKSVKTPRQKETKPFYIDTISTEPTREGKKAAERIEDLGKKEKRCDCKRHKRENSTTETQRRKQETLEREEEMGRGRSARSDKDCEIAGRNVCNSRNILDAGRNGWREGGKEARQEQQTAAYHPATQPPAPPPPSLSKRKTYNPLSLFFFKNNYWRDFAKK